MLFGFRPAGLAHVPPSGPCIVAPNHQSYLDGLLIGAGLPFHALRRIFFVGAAEYYQSAASRWLARLASIVPVDPDANLVAAMQISAAGLRAGRVLVLFPEGERSIDGEVKTFRKGAAILSSHLAAPIVPAGLDGPYALWPRSRPFNWLALLPWRAPRVALAFGAPIVAARGADAAVTAELQQSVERLVEHLRGGE
jgi:long-chain acyl-CoA synthetase